MESVAKAYHPSLLWSQNTKHIFLKAVLADVEDPKVTTGANFVRFNGTGSGANGLQRYAFELNLYRNIVTDNTEFKVTDQNVTITMVKEAVEVWPRLTESTDRLPWLRIDFNSLTDDILSQMGGDDVPSDEETDEGKVSIKMIHPSAEEQTQRREHMLEENAKDQWNELVAMFKNPLVLYLFIYNIFQWAGYIFVFGTLVRSWYNDGDERKTKAFNLVADRLCIVQLASFLEIAHVFLGWVKGGLVPTILQVCGRNLIFFVILLPHEELYEDPAVFNLFLAWSCIELVRYPYYSLSLLGESIGLITYLRYTLWIPLYPIGFMCEGKLIILSLPLLEKSRRFCLDMPNSLNFSFDFPKVLQIYFLLMMPVFYMLMQHMYKARQSKLSPRHATRRHTKRTQLPQGARLDTLR